MEMLESNITAQFLCMTLEMHFSEQKYTGTNLRWLG